MPHVNLTQQFIRTPGGGTEVHFGQRTRGQSEADQDLVVGRRNPGANEMQIRLTQRFGVFGPVISETVTLPSQRSSDLASATAYVAVRSQRHRMAGNSDWLSANNLHALQVGLAGGTIACGIAYAKGAAMLTGSLIGAVAGFGLGWLVAETARAEAEKDAVFAIAVDTLIRREPQGQPLSGYARSELADLRNMADTDFRRQIMADATREIAQRFPEQSRPEGSTSAQQRD